MKADKTPMDPQKILKKMAAVILTVGAGLTLGFLSFGGMYALIPILPLAYASFILSVAYEGEIYWQNIQGAFSKLFKSHYLEHQLAKKYLRTHFPEQIDEQTPQFFKDYKAQLELLATYGHEQLDSPSKKKKKHIKKTLSDMEQWFTLQLFEDNNSPSAYAQELQQWLDEQGQKKWQEKLKKKRFKFQLVKGFSILSGLFMGLGSTYLIVEAFSIIPFFATIPFVSWPLLVVPMAVIAGLAYGMLIYNAVTDLINNNTVIKWYNQLKNDLSKGVSFYNVVMAASAILLVGLAIALTICTAGTWWTIATQAQPLFEWMKKIPSFVLGILTPLITGLSALFFNIQNTAESLEMIDNTFKGKNFVDRISEWFQSGYEHLLATEHWLQIINPFRLALKLTVTPLRIIFFVGHLLSIAVTTDRMPGISQIMSTLIALISEGFEDASYFNFIDDVHTEQQEHTFSELLNERLEEKSGHSHDMDFPSWLLKHLLSPVYALAALWDAGAKKIIAPNEADASESFAETFGASWDKQWGNKDSKTIELPVDAPRPSSAWQQEHTVAQIEKFQRKHLESAVFNSEVAKNKILELNRFKEKVHTLPPETIQEELQKERTKKVYARHRFFTLNEVFSGQQVEKTRTEHFLDSLPKRVCNK